MQDIHLLILLDLTKAFNTADHDILHSRLHSTTGLSDSVLSCFQFYLWEGLEITEDAKSWILPVMCGVPQGLVLSTIPLILYMLPLCNAISWHELSFHCYSNTAIS